MQSGMLLGTIAIFALAAGGCQRVHSVRHDLQLDGITVTVVARTAVALSGGYDYISGTKRYDYSIGTNRLTVIESQLFVDGHAYGALKPNDLVEIEASAVRINGHVREAAQLEQRDYDRVYPPRTFRCFIGGAKVETHTRATVAVCESPWGRVWLEVGTNRLSISRGRVRWNGVDLGLVPDDKPIVVRQREGRIDVELPPQGDHPKTNSTGP